MAFGAHQLDPEDDYPDFIIHMAWAVASAEVERGVALCGSGVGASIAANRSSEALFFELALEDLTQAAEMLRPIHEQSGRVDGWVSLEVSPPLAHDDKNTLAAAKELHAPGDCEEVLARFTKAGIDIDALATELQDEWARSSARSWKELMARIASKSEALNDPFGDVDSRNRGFELRRDHVGARKRGRCAVR